MFIDLASRFSGTTSAAGVIAGDLLTATAISANVMDLRNGLLGAQATADESINEHNLWWTVISDVALTSGGATTLTISLESDSAAGLATLPVVHFTTAAIPKATLVAGAIPVQTMLPSGALVPYKRFLGVRYTVATGPFTGGSVQSFLTFDIPRNTTYGIGYTIDV